MRCRAELGPERAKSFPGRRLVRAAADRAQRPRATPAIDDGWRGRGAVCGACVPATGEALTGPADRRPTAPWVACLAQGEPWRDPTAAPGSAVRDTRPAPRALAGLLWALAHPRWEFVVQPTYAASLTRREPWWQGRRSLARKGRRCDPWEAVGPAVAVTTP